MADTQLILKTLVEWTADARKKLDEVSKSVNNLWESTKKFDSISKKLEDNAAWFAAIAASAGIAFYAITKWANEAIQASTRQENALTGLRSIVEGTGNDFSKAKQFIDEYTSDGLVPLGNAATSLKNLLSRWFGLDEARVIMDRFKDSAAFGRQASLGLWEAIQWATEGIKNENSILVDNAGVTKNVSMMWDEYASKIWKTRNELSLTEKREAEYQWILKETKFQVWDAAKLSESYAWAVARSAAATTQLKVAIGDSLKPAMEAFYNVITPIIVKLTEFSKAHPNIIAGITGLVVVVTGAILALSSLALAVVGVTKWIAALKIAWEALSLLWSWKLIPMARAVGVAVMGISAPAWAIIAVIAALIAIWVLLYKNWDEISKKSSESWAKIRQVQITEWMTIGRAWDALWNAMWQTVTEIWAAIKNVVVIGIKWIVEAINFVIRRSNDLARLGNLLVPGDPIKIFEEIDPNKAVAGVKSAVTGVYNYASTALKWVGAEAVATTKEVVDQIKAATTWGGAGTGGAKKATEDLKKIINELKNDASAMNAELTEWAKKQRETLIELNKEYKNLQQELTKIKAKWIEELAELQQWFSELQQKGIEEMQKLQEWFTELKNKWIQEIQDLRNQITGLNSDMANVQSTGISDIAKRAIAAQRELQKIAGIAKESDVLSKAQSMSREELMWFAARGRAFDIGGQKVTADNLIKVLDLTKEIALAKTMVTEQDIQNAEVATNRTDVEKIIEKMNLDSIAIEAKIKSVNDEIIKKQELHTIELQQYTDRMNKSKIEHDKELQQYQVRINKKIADNAAEIASHTELMEKKEMQIRNEFETYKDLVNQKRILDNNYFAYFGEQIQKQITQVESLISKMRSLGWMWLNIWWLSGARANGWPVNGGESYLVGERWPEIFTPAGGGRITPNNRIGGGNTYVTITGTFGQWVAEELGDYLVRKLGRSVAI